MSLSCEEWRDVVGYEGLYQVSNLGRVRSFDRISAGPCGSTQLHRGRMLSERTTRIRRRAVNLAKDGKALQKSIDSLVANAFVENPDNKPTLYHINGDVLDCRAENLMWVTASELRAMWSDANGCMPHKIDTLEGECWRDVPGYEGLYKVSSLGRVYQVDTVRAMRDGGFGVRWGKLMRQNRLRNGYVVVSLSDGPNRKTYNVHRLVALAFIPNPGNLSDVDHIDADPSNNAVSNLRWVTRSENVRHTVELGNGSMRGRLARRPVIRSDGKFYESIASAARDLGMKNGSPISHMLSGKVLSVKGYTFSLA